MSEAATDAIAWPAVARHLAEAGLALALEPAPRRCSGGLANRNYKVRVDGRPAIFRCPPAGDLPPGAHDMAREHRILRALAPVLDLVPDSFHHCEDRRVIGVPFQLIEFRDGLVLRGDTPPARYDDAGRMRRLAETVIGTLARIHAVDTEAAGLAEFGRPAGFLARAVSGWARRAAVCDGEPDLARRRDALVDWLAANIGAVPDSAPVLLHCDLKLDNLILDEADLSPRAVIDWDMGTRGHPLFDLATTLSYWTEPGDPPCLHALAQMPSARPGFLTRREAAALYARLGGRDLAGLETVRILALFKLAIVFLQLHRRWREGALRGAAYAGFADLGGAILGHAHDIAIGDHPPL